LGVRATGVEHTFRVFGGFGHSRPKNAEKCRFSAKFCFLGAGRPKMPFWSFLGRLCTKPKPGPLPGLGNRSKPPKIGPTVYQTSFLGVLAILNGPEMAKMPFLAVLGQLCTKKGPFLSKSAQKGPFLQKWPSLSTFASKRTLFGTQSAQNRQKRHFWSF